MRINRHLALALAFGIALQLCTAVSVAAVNLKVIATDPASTELTLKPGQNYSLKIAYDTDEPIHIWARPFFRGSEVSAMTNASDVYTGTGEALGWFALTGPGEVDEVRLLIDHKNSGRGQDAGSFPVKITVGEKASQSEPAPSAAWVSSLIKKSEDSRRAERIAHENEPASFSDRLIVPGFLFAVLALLVCSIGGPIWAFFRWQGGWRLAAAVPLVLMLGTIARIVVDVAVDPTSHNLWPFEILMVGAVATAAIVAMAVLHRILVRRAVDAQYPG